MAQNHVWRYTLRLFTHFDISEQCFKIDAEMCPKTCKLLTTFGQQISWFLQTLSKTTFGRLQAAIGGQNVTVFVFLEPFLDFVGQKRSKSGVGFPPVDCFFADLVFRFSAEAPPEQIGCNFDAILMQFRCKIDTIMSRFETYFARTVKAVWL